MSMPANRAWFSFAIENDSTPFRVHGFQGKEEIGLPYEFTISLVASRDDIDIVGLLGKRALLTITDRSMRDRYIHGVIQQFEQTGTGNEFTHYECILVPKAWFLYQTEDHRIFQNKTVLDIIQIILQEQGFPAEDWKMQCSGKYKKRDYCVQYSESDLHFIARLCEEEGIYYYFEHGKFGHCMCFSDLPEGVPISGRETVRHVGGSGMVADGPFI